MAELTGRRKRASSMMGSASQGNPEETGGVLTVHSRALCKGRQLSPTDLECLSHCPGAPLDTGGRRQRTYEYQGKRCVYTAGNLKMILKNIHRSNEVPYFLTPWPYNSTFCLLLISAIQI